MVGSLVGDRLGTEIALAGRTEVSSADAYRAFIEAHLADAYRLATFILGDRADAEDAVHDAAISAWRHWPDRREPSRSAAWFRRIVVNACRDRIRARGRVRSVPVGLTPPAASHPLIPDATDAVSARDALARRLAQLPFEDRALVTLRFGLDLTVPAIAATLGLREGTVKSRLHRAIEALRSETSERVP